VAPQGVFGLSVPPGGVSRVRDPGHTHVLGGWQKPTDRGVYVVLGWLGQAAELERSRRGQCTTGDQVFCSMEQAVTWGRAHQDLSGVEAIGIEEIAWQRGHRDLTLGSQIDGHGKRWLWIGAQGPVKTLVRFFRRFGTARS